MLHLGGWEWVILLVIVLIVFGVGRLPEIGGALGKSIREFREASGKDDKKKDKEKEQEPAETEGQSSDEK